MSVYHADHGSIATGLFRPGVVFVKFPSRVVVRDVENAVRWCDRQVTEKRLVFVLANELFGSIDDHIVRIVGASAAPLVSFENELFAVFYDVRRIVAVGMHLVVVADEEVETVFFWDAR